MAEQMVHEQLSGAIGPVAEAPPAHSRGTVWLPTDLVVVW
jgi:hypothetical protein